MNRAPRIALLVDNPYRDLPGLVLTAWRLAQSGAACHLVPMNLRHQEVWALAPDLVLLNHLRTVYDRFARELVDSGILVGVLDTEGGVFSPIPIRAHPSSRNVTRNKGESPPPTQQYALVLTQDSDLRHSMARYCAWSPAFAEYAMQEGWFRPEQIAVTGTPRMDFYAPQWRDAARRTSSHIDSYSEPMVLINSSFPLSNPRFQSPGKEAAALVDKFSFDQDFIDEWMSTQDSGMRGMVALANRLAARFPEVTFIYRPHPFENEETYRALLEPLPNLHLVKKGTVDGWLLRARALIHCGSSTAIDACLAGVPAFAPGWIPTQLPIPAVDDVSIKCYTEGELMERIAEVLAGAFELPSEIVGNIDRVVEETFYKIDGNAHQRVADALLEAIDTAETSTSIRVCRRLAGADKHSPLKGGVMAAIKRTFGPRQGLPDPVSSELPWDRSDKYFDTAGVKATIDTITDCAEAADIGRVRPVGVQPAQQPEDYLFGYRDGRSVKVFPR